MRRPITQKLRKPASHWSIKNISWAQSRLLWGFLHICIDTCVESCIWLLPNSPFWLQTSLLLRNVSCEKPVNFWKISCRIWSYLDLLGVQDHLTRGPHQIQNLTLPCQIVRLVHIVLPAAFHQSDYACKWRKISNLTGKLIYLSHVNDSNIGKAKSACWISCWMTLMIVFLIKWWKTLNCRSNARHKVVQSRVKFPHPLWPSIWFWDYIVWWPKKSLDDKARKEVLVPLKPWKRDPGRQSWMTSSYPPVTRCTHYRNILPHWCMPW